MSKRDIGLLVMRVGLGIMFVLHGIPKIVGGSDAWKGLAQMVVPGVDGFAASALGLSAAIAEILGGILLATGCFYPIGMVILIGVMAGATLAKLTGGGYDFLSFAQTVGWPLELMIVFIGLLLTGPGRLVLRMKSG